MAATMKMFVVVALVCFAGVTQSTPASITINPVGKHVYQLTPQVWLTVNPVVKNNDVDVCQVCIDFAGEALQELLNLILNKAVTGTCGKLCGALYNATHKEPLQKACNIICDLEGIKAFVNWIQHSDLSPIFDCQNLGVCKFNDYGDAEVVSFGVQPPRGPQGTTFAVILDWATRNGTGTGEIRFDIATMDHVELDIPTVYIPDTAVANTSTITLNMKASPDPTCDPSQGPCEKWFFGKYNVSTWICEGECGDTKHPHTSLYASANTSFEITKPGPPGPPPPPPPPPPPGQRPWADPNDGACPNNELNISIKGVAGEFCSPGCTATSDCPGAPFGVTAKPECVLDSQGSKTPTQCALICTFGTTCPHKATCKKLKATGICTFDS